MKLEDQVCSLELAKRLRGLGVNQLSQFLWNRDGFISFRVAPSEKTWPGEYAAFTVAELGMMLPESIGSQPDHGHLHIGYGTRAVGQWTIGYANYEKRVTEIFDGKSEADTRAKCLIYLIEQGLVKI